MTDKHYINVQYKDLKNPGSKRFGLITKSGRDKQIELSLSRGSGAQPDVQWSVSHTPCADDEFIKAPIMTARGSNKQGTKLYFDMTVPNIGGVEWTVKCRFGAAPRVHDVARFEVWRRIMLSATCPNVDCAKTFETAMTMVKKAFEPGFIEILTNEVAVAGAARPRKAGREGGSDCEMRVTFRLPSWEEFRQKFELTVTRATVEGNEFWRKEGDLLICTLLEHDNYRAVVPREGNDVYYIERFHAACDDEQVVKLPALNGFPQAADAAAFRSLCQIRKDGAAVWSAAEVQAATEIVFDLASAPFAAAKAKLDEGETVKLDFDVFLEQFGRSAGGASANDPSFFLTFYPDTTAKTLANVLTHEIAHTMYLVKDTETDRSGRGVKNLDYHTNDYGGNGPHCSHNCKRVDAGTTTSGYKYVPDETRGPPCTMHFQASEAVDDGKFCLNCIAQLRRATLPRQLQVARVDP